MDADAAGRSSLSDAFRRAYEGAGLSQQALSAATGIDQSLISKYARGATQPPLDALVKVDRACGRPKGYVLRLAGYVDDDLDIKAALASDPTPEPDGRGMVVRLYEMLQDDARRSRNHSASS